MPPEDRDGSEPRYTGLSSISTAGTKHHAYAALSHGEATPRRPRTLLRQAERAHASKPKSARFDWGDGETTVNVTFLDKGEAKGTVAVAHERLADAGEAERMKAYWRARVAALKDLLEG